MDNFFTTEQKDAIRLMTKQYIDNFGGLNKAANSLNHISPSTLSSVTRGLYANISDDMWRNLRGQVGTDDQSTATVDTPVVKDLHFCMNETRVKKEFVWAISPAGSGKTMSAKLMQQQKNVFYMLCDEDMKKSSFATELARAVGMRVNTQKSARTTIMEVIKFVKEKENVLIIFDEGDKLSDNVIHYFITIYNHFENVSGELEIGMLFLSTDYMDKRMKNGLKRNIKGYQELWSRMGSRFYEVEKNTAYDVDAICRIRGVNNQKDINTVIKEVEGIGFDLRRANRKIKAIIRKREQTTTNI